MTRMKTRQVNSRSSKIINLLIKLDQISPSLVIDKSIGYEYGLEACSDDPDTEFKIFSHIWNTITPCFLKYLFSNAHIETSRMVWPNLVITSPDTSSSQKRGHGMTDSSLKWSERIKSSIRTPESINLMQLQIAIYLLKVI